ncbi:MAG: hypothetical protein WC315_00680 [Candidatus Omnitrophota bacterium]|jgi:hypothetical protein
MLVAYSYSNEVLVCHAKDEAKMLDVWFANGGRDPEDYDREEFDSVVRVGSRTHCKGD